MSAPNFYGIIPAPVRYCEGLIPNAKLLYCEITALTSEKGHCWASNAYFAKLYSVSEYTVSRWISQLQEFGFITVKVDRSAGNQRFIYIKEAAPLLRKSARGIDEKRKTSCGKTQDPLAEKRKHSIIESNTISITVSSDDAPAEKKQGGRSAQKNVEQKESPLPAPPFFSEQLQPAPALFSESPWPKSSLSDWAAAFGSACDIPNVDPYWYFSRCRDWSAEKGGKSLDWISTARKFALDDQRKNKLVTIQSASSNEYSNSTTTNSGNHTAGNNGTIDRAAADRAATIATAARIAARRRQQRSRFGEC